MPTNRIKFQRTFMSCVAAVVVISFHAFAVDPVIPIGPGVHIPAATKHLNVQGKLTDVGGNALSGSYTVTFRLYASASEPVTNALWTENQSVTTQGGLFNVSLGNAYSMDSVAFNKPYYLGIQVAGDPNELSPRQLLGASAYALGSLGDFNVKGNLTSSGTVTAVTMSVSGVDVAGGLIPPGTILPFGGAAAPAGFLMCDGSAVSRTDYSNLFAAIDTRWGTGDGSVTFNLPDLRGRTPVGMGQGAGLSSRSLGETFGEEAHVLSLAEMPSHSHDIVDPGHSHGGTFGWDPGPLSSGGGYQIYGVRGLDARNGNSYLRPGGIPASGTGISIQPNGGAGAHKIMQPSAVVNFMIKS